jgi:hypothetical protein
MKARHGTNNSKAELAKLNGMLRMWRKNNILDTEKRPDDKRREREFYIGGNAPPTHLQANGASPEDEPL